MELRPAWRSVWESCLRVDFRCHCLPAFADVTAAVADVPGTAPLRRLVANAKWLARVPSLSFDDRMAIYRRQSPANSVEN
jgi:hypothetical protein